MMTLLKIGLVIFAIQAIVVIVQGFFYLLNKFFNWLLVELYLLIGVMIYHIVLSPYYLLKSLCWIVKTIWQWWQDRQDNSTALVSK